MRGIGLDLGIQDDRERTAAGAPAGAGEADSGQRAIESIAIDQAAEVPIVDWVGRWARERPGGDALVDVRASGTRTWTWEELDREADKAAAVAAGARGRAGRDGRLPAAELGRVRDPEPWPA